MADTDVRILRDVETCVDDSPPVCLVPLVHNKLVSQRSPDRCTHRDLGNACDKSSATTSDMSPTVLQATPELTITLHASATESMVPVAESKEQQSPELSVLDSVHKDEAVEQAKEQTSCRDSAAVTPETVEISRKRVVLASQDNVRIVEGCPPQCEAAVNPLAPSNDDLATADHPETCDQVRFPTLPEMAEHDEDDDFDLEDRPLTVDVSLALDTTPEDRNAGKEKATPATERETQNVVPAEPVCTASESGPTSLSSAHPAPSQPTEDIVTSTNGPSDDCQPDPGSTIAEVLAPLPSDSNRNHLVASELLPPETPPNSTITNTVGSPLQQNGVDLSYPTVSLTNKAETSVVFVTCLQPFTTPITSVLDIRPKPTTPQPTVLPVASSATPTVASSSTALLTSQPNTAQLMSFATGTGVSSSGVPLNSLPVTATALPLPGTGVGSGSTLQFLNMTPVPQFLGAPGIVLHSAGAPTFQSPATPLLPGLSTPGLGAGTALNFLQPNNQPFTTMLQPPMGTGGDFLFDASLGLSHQIVPTSSIALFSPVTCCSSMVESYAPTHLSPFYPTLVQPPHNPSLLPTSTSVFIPPNYRPPSTVVTNLVNATTSQMATSMSGSAGPNIFPAPTLSLAGNPSVGSNSLFLQTAPAPLISPPFGPGTTPLFQCPFSSYSIPLQGSTEACLPSTVAASLTTKTTSVYRIEDLNIAPPSGVPVLPPLWTAPSTLPTLCPNPQPAPTAPSVPVVSSSSGVVNIAPLLPQPPTLQPCPAVSKQLRRFQTPNLSGRSAQQTMRAGGAATSVTNVLPKTTSLPSTNRPAGNMGIVMPNSTTILPPIRRRRPLLHPVKSKQPPVGLQPSVGPSLPSDGENQAATVGPAGRTPNSTPTDTARIHLSTDTASSLYTNSGEAIPPDNSPSKCSSSASPVSVRTSPVLSASARHHSGSAAPPNESAQSPIQEEPSAAFLSHPVVSHHSQANESFDPSGSSRTVSSPVKTSLPSPQQSPIGATHRSSNSVISSSTRSSSGCNSSSTSPANQRKGPSPVASPSTSYPPKTSTVDHENVEFHSSLERLGMSFKSATHGIYRGNSTTPLEATGLLPVHRKSSTASAHGGSQKMPPPLLHHGPEGLRIWMHVVGGHVIYESNKPFPVKNGMSVVEAALLNECLNEEKEVVGDTVSTHKRPNEPNVPVLNGHEPMQLESELEEPKSSVSLSDNKSDASNKRLFGSVETNGKPQPTVFERLSNGPSSMVEKEHPKTNGPEFTLKPSKNTDESLALSHGVQVSTDTGFPLHTVGASGDEMFSRGINSGSAIRVPTPVMSSSVSTAPSLTDAASSSAPAFAQARPPMQQSGFFPFAQHSHTPQLPTPPPPGPVRKWTPEDVVAFVQGTPGCAAYASAFLTNEIDGEALLLLAKDQFIHPPIGMKIGPALKLAARLESIRHIN
ncbi:hypothetical protein CSKR_112542 [Clonorchis sinensis]|uniref:SAM domain-containing protein n=1 Tax=Clonorchis sinensis TaxID=79923 RepID=A0A8T1MU86_CLOSI|nr:hypothetical protein CSKR_112542 [Clonorchis sinensis]